jgi:choline dehydrogenase-like flavoprotein
VTPERYEYVMVGSGVAGATLASQILDRDPGAAILILEAGPRVPEKDRRGWWDYVLSGRKPYDFCLDVEGENTTIGDVNWGFFDSRVMVYGGSTSHWGGWSLRYQPEDFNLWTNTGEGADWPIDYQDLRDYYHLAEQFLSVCGDLSESWNQIRQDQPYPLPPYGWTAADGVMLEGFEAAGIEPGQMPLARYRRCLTTGTCKYCPFGSRFTAQAVLEDLESDPRYPNLTIRSSTVVNQIVLRSKHLVEGVEYLDSITGETATALADTVVVCAGTYESPKLLRRSESVHWPDGIGNQKDLVGRFIVSHSFLRVSGQFPTNPEHWLQELDFPTLMSRQYDAPEYQKDGKIFLFKNRALPNVDIAALMIAGKSRAEINAVLGGPMQFELQAFYEEKGQWGNRLSPKKAKNRFGLPLTEIRYFRNPDFPRQAQSRLALMKPVFEAMGIKNVSASADDPGGHHSTGTCRMAETVDKGVVDENLRVFDTENLYVCSNAAFPTCAAVNPTLTLVAMSMRLADHLSPLPPYRLIPAAGGRTGDADSVL